MIEKRFTLDEWDIWDYADTMLVILQNGEFISNADVCELLNNLIEENEQLKSDNNRLVNETAKVVAEHQKKVLDLIDEKIDKLEKRYKFGQEVYKGCPMHNILFGINSLKELKKELQE